MPEGHQTHFIASKHSDVFAGQILRITSPQGRFRRDARRVTGKRLGRVSAVGKHLFYKFEDAPMIHVHLGRYGKFRQHDTPAPRPVGKVRMRLQGQATTVDLNGPSTCRVIDDLEYQQVVSRLGPDPLGAGKKAQAWTRIRDSKKPIGALLLDQSVIAGIGNIFRAEILHDIQLSPSIPGCCLDKADFDRLWRSTTRLMKLGLKHGKIVTVSAKEAGLPIASIKGNNRFRVYGREECFDCGHPIETINLASRKLYLCPSCQVSTGS